MRFYIEGSSSFVAPLLLRLLPRGTNQLLGRISLLWISTFSRRTPVYALYVQATETVCPSSGSTESCSLTVRGAHYNSARG
jgi:hypothetical protein